MDARKMCSVISLCCLISFLPAFLGQELAHFSNDTTIDFGPDTVLAEIMPGDKNIQTTEYYSAVKDVRPSTIMESDVIIKPKEGTVISPDEVTVRLGRVLDRDVTTIDMATLHQFPEATTTSINSAMVTSNRGGVQRDLTETSTAVSPPNIKQPLSQEIIIVLEKEKKQYNFNCKADGYPQPSYTWLKDGQPIRDTTGFITPIENGTLLFKEFSTRENGVYQCFASNIYGTSVSVKVQLVLEQVPKRDSSPGNLTESYLVNEGEPMSFKCHDTPPTVPEYTKRWYSTKDSQTYEVKISNRIGTDSKGVLRFTYVEQSDAASYICALVPNVLAAGDFIQFYNTVVLKVHQQQKTPSKPTLAYTSSKVKATLGRNATLECFFNGYPIPKIHWTNSSNHNIQIDDKKFIIEDSGRKLTIVRSQENDAGTFTCEGMNGFGRQMESIVVNVTGPPMKIQYEGLNTQTEAEGRDVVLKCKAQAVARQHLDSPTWYRNGKPLDESNLPFPGRYSFGAGRTELHIKNLNKNVDTACFQCNISNSEGYLFLDGYLRVINSIVIEKKPKSVNVVSVDSVIDITVHVKGDECCPLDKRWTFNGAPLTIAELHQKPFVMSENDDVFLFNASSVNNATLLSKMGNYTFRASDNFQFVEISFMISLNAIESTPEPLMKETAGIQLWWIGLVCGILLILIAIIIIVVVVKSNYPRDTYLLGKTEIKHHLNPEKDLLDQSFQEI